MKQNKLKITQNLLLTGILSVWLAALPARLLGQIPPDGKYITYYSNGNRHEKGYYTNNQKDKRWYFYNEKGIIARKEKWVKGELQWTIHYSEKGKITRTIDKEGKERVRPACGC